MMLGEILRHGAPRLFGLGESSKAFLRFAFSRVGFLLTAQPLPLSARSNKKTWAWVASAKAPCFIASSRSRATCKWTPNITSLCFLLAEDSRGTVMLSHELIRGECPDNRAGPIPGLFSRRRLRYRE